MIVVVILVVLLTDTVGETLVVVVFVLEALAQASIPDRITCEPAQIKAYTSNSRESSRVANSPINLFNKPLAAMSSSLSPSTRSSFFIRVNTSWTSVILLLLDRNVSPPSLLVVILVVTLQLLVSAVIMTNLS